MSDGQFTGDGTMVVGFFSLILFLMFDHKYEACALCDKFWVLIDFSIRRGICLEIGLST